MPYKPPAVRRGRRSGPRTERRDDEQWYPKMPETLPVYGGLSMRKPPPSPAKGVRAANRELCPSSAETKAPPNPQGLNTGINLRRHSTSPLCLADLFQPLCMRSPHPQVWHRAPMSAGPAPQALACLASPHVTQVWHWVGYGRGSPDSRPRPSSHVKRGVCASPSVSYLFCPRRA